MFLEDVKLFRLRNVTLESQLTKEFLGKLTLALNDFPQDEEIETMYKSTALEL